MIKIDFEALNPLERTIHTKLVEASEKRDGLRIYEAAALCDCSPSKISKFTRKLGFANFKQYVDFLYGRTVPHVATSSEIDRLSSYLDAFDNGPVEQMAALIESRDKLVLLGYGPSFLCAQYFEYKFKACLQKVTIAAPDELTSASILDDNTLLLIFTVTGTFASFDAIYAEAKRKGGDVAILMEEYNPALLARYDTVFCLAKQSQPGNLHPYEKSRTVFFIFMEEVIRLLMSKRDERA